MIEARHPGCMPCDLEDSDPAAVVYRDDDWSCEVAVGWDVPGWFILRTRRHLEWWSGPSPEQFGKFGQLSQRLAVAITRATDARTTYFVSFGENYPHFHFLLAARPHDLSPEFRGTGILSMRESHRDLEGSMDAAAAVRGLLN